MNVTNSQVIFFSGIYIHELTRSTENLLTDFRTLYGATSRHVTAWVQNLVLPSPYFHHYVLRSVTFNKQSRYKIQLNNQGLAPTRYSHCPALRHRTAGLKLHHNRFVSSTEPDTTWCNLNHKREADEKPTTIRTQLSLIVWVEIKLRMTISVNNFYSQFPSIWHSQLKIVRTAL